MKNRDDGGYGDDGDDGGGVDEAFECRVGLFMKRCERNCLKRIDVQLMKLKYNPMDSLE